MGVIHHLPPRGHYLAHEVGRLAGVSGHTVGQWARRGFIRSSQSQTQPRVYSFQDVAEAIVVHELLDEGFSHQQIKTLIHALREHYGDWPLTVAPLAVAEDPTAESTWKALLLVYPEGPYEWARAGLQQTHVSELRRVAGELRRGGWATRNLPDLEHVEVDPDRLSGKPTVRGRRISVEHVARLAGQPGGRELLADDYDLRSEEIDDAVRWWRATEAYENQAA